MINNSTNNSALKKTGQKIEHVRNRETDFYLE
jgi:hypothetical protein